MMIGTVHAKRQQRGFTLVELLIAMAIGLVVTGIAAKIFSESHRVARKTEAFSRIQENGRLADSVLGRDLREAGSFGCARLDSGNASSNLNGTSIDLTGPSITGQENAGGASVNNSDTITLRGATGTGSRVTDDNGSANLELASVRGLQQGDIMVVTNCNNNRGSAGAEIFQVTNITGSDKVVHSKGQPNGLSPGNASPKLNNQYPGGMAFAVRQTSYRVVDSGGVPTLQRRVNDGGWQDLIARVYGMQIVYGEDTDADDVANRYVPANGVGNFDNVVAARVQLLIGGDVIRVAGTGATSNLDASGNQQLSFGGAFGGGTVTLPGGRVGQRFTIAAALRGRLP